MAKKGKARKYGISHEDTEWVEGEAKTPSVVPKVFNPLEKLTKFKPLNKSQSQLQQLLIDKDIIFGIGSAGTGKTYASLAIALNLLKDKGSHYECVSLCKSVIAVKEEELGFLPGDITEKLEPFMYSFTGNINKILKSKNANTTLMSAGLVEWRPITYLRGCQYDQRIVIVDEVQNITMHDFKTIITRLGKYSKIIFLGDIEQIDRNGKTNSCLSIISELFKESVDIGVVLFDEEEHFRKPAITSILKTLRSAGY